MTSPAIKILFLPGHSHNTLGRPVRRRPTHPGSRLRAHPRHQKRKTTTTPQPPQATMHKQKSRVRPPMCPKRRSAQSHDAPGCNRTLLVVSPPPSPPLPPAPAAGPRCRTRSAAAAATRWPHKRAASTKGGAMAPIHTARFLYDSPHHRRWPTKGRGDRTAAVRRERWGGHRHRACSQHL